MKAGKIELELARQETPGQAIDMFLDPEKGLTLLEVIWGDDVERDYGDFDQEAFLTIVPAALPRLVAALVGTPVEVSVDDAGVVAFDLIRRRWAGDLAAAGTVREICDRAGVPYSFQVW